MPAAPNSDTVARAAPLRRANLPAAIAAELRARIEAGELSPGAQLPGHRDLAARFDVSVGSVREAISMLVSAGLVETRAGRGTFVADAFADDGVVARVAGAPLDRREVEELIEARRVIEGHLAAMAAERATPEQIERLYAAVDHIDEAQADARAYGVADVEFHLVLAEAADNRYLLRALLDIRSHLRADMELAAEVAIRRFGNLGFSVDSHRELADAIAGRDPETARTLLASMVQRNRDAVVGLYALAPPRGRA